MPALVLNYFGQAANLIRATGESDARESFGKSVERRVVAQQCRTVLRLLHSENEDVRFRFGWRLGTDAKLWHCHPAMVPARPTRFVRRVRCGRARTAGAGEAP